MRKSIPLTKERRAKVESIFAYSTETGECYSVHLKTTEDTIWCDSISEIYRAIDEN